ncbi:MAG: EF-hand domain-containing protein [Planctomycetota bacterium]|nr:EF-hand domain-containing protein [Planctomycetota bacterium]
MNRILPIALGLFAALVLTAVPAAAEDLPQTSRFFEEYDKDADGFVTEQEFDGSREVFRLLDKNDDGKVSTAELGLPADYRPDPNAKKRREMAERRNRGRRGGNSQQDRMQRLRRLFEQADVNQDGVVTKAEWKGNANLFDRLDRNQDGKLDRTDYPALFGAMGMDDEMMGGGDGKGAKPKTDVTPGGAEPNKKPRANKADKPGKGMRGMRDLSVEQVRKRFQELDQDADQQLTAEDGVNAKLVERMDTDQSGGVSLAEFEAAVTKAQKRAKPAKKGGGANPDRIKKMLQRFDQDRDGKVSRDEFPGSDDRFDRMDVNKDGFLSDADFADPDEKPADKPKSDDDTPTTPGADG